MKQLITEDHINNGIRNDSRYCPIALSLKDKYPQATTIEAEYIGIEIEFEEGNSIRFYLGNNAYDFMSKFDEGHEIEPCIIDLKYS